MFFLAGRKQLRRERDEAIRNTRALETDSRRISNVISGALKSEREANAELRKALEDSRKRAALHKESKERAVRAWIEERALGRELAGTLASAAEFLAAYNGWVPRGRDEWFQGEDGPHDLVGAIARCGLFNLANALSELTKIFGPRRNEDGEGVKPADPSDGAECKRTVSSSVGRAAPHAEVQEGAERSRVGGPSTLSARLEAYAQAERELFRRSDSLWFAGRAAALSEAARLVEDHSTAHTISITIEGDGDASP